jgi:hypothetical protein
MIEVDDNTPKKLKEYFTKLRGMQLAALDYRHGHSFDAGHIYFAKEDMKDISLLEVFFNGFEKQADGRYKQDYGNIAVFITISEGMAYREEIGFLEGDKIKVRKGGYVSTGNIDISWKMYRSYELGKITSFNKL